MDEAFRHLGDMIAALVDQPPVVGQGPLSQRVSMTAIEVEMPLELDITRDAAGALAIGITPPLYLLKTSVLPSFHQMRLRASLRPDPGDEANDAE